METLLEARGITKSFPGVRALDNVNFDLLPGEVHALVGENGAGKSTLVNILTGLLRPDDGEILLRGKPTVFDTPHAARRAGIGAIHQELAFVPILDVATNLALGQIPVREGWLSRMVGGIVDRPALQRQAVAALAKVGNPVQPQTPGERLSVAQAQLLEIARALSSEFSLILFDEPTSSLGPTERDALFGHIAALRKSGNGVLYISHRLEEVMEIADRVTIMRDGHVVATSSASTITIDQIIQSMTGRAKRTTEPRSQSRGAPVLEVRGLTSLPELENVNFTVHAGEIVGLTGLVGAGRTEVARCLIGADPYDHGEIWLDGATVRPGSPREAINLGIGYATEDRKGEGIFHDCSVTDNILLGPLVKRVLARIFVAGGTWLNRQTIRALVAPLIGRLDVRPPNLDALVGTMSGGNQQKVILARLIASKPRVLILDEPTRGIDVGTKNEIWRFIKQLADEGVAVLAISSEVPELIDNVDRILVMRRGTVSGEVAGHAVDENEVLRLAI